jgi:hypothetical protein
MLPRNEPVVPSFPVYPPIDVFLETRGNKSGNEIVSSPRKLALSEGRLS